MHYARNSNITFVLPHVSFMAFARCFCLCDPWTCAERSRMKHDLWQADEKHSEEQYKMFPFSSHCSVSLLLLVWFTCCLNVNMEETEEINQRQLKSVCTNQRAAHLSQRCIMQRVDLLEELTHWCCSGLQIIEILVHTSFFYSLKLTVSFIIQMTPSPSLEWSNGRHKLPSSEQPPLHY